MNKLTKFTFLACLLIFLVSSCTKEDSQPFDDSNTDLVAVNSELGDLLLRTSDNNNTSSIDCIDLVYPLTFFIYNSNQQQTGTQTVGNDGELLAFLLSLEPGTYIALQFPISVVLQDGTIVQVNSNAELVTLISDCSSNGGGFPSDFETILTSGSWFVTYFFDDVDETSDFAGYEFTFGTDNTARAVSTSNMVDGTWSLTNSNTPDLNLFFGTNDPFDELDEDWDIIEATPDIIKLKHISGGDGSVDFLTYERTPNGGGGGGGNTSEFTDNLTNSVWYVNLLDDDGNNETCDYVAYEFKFNANETVTATSTNNTVNGIWAVTNSSSGIDLVLNFEITGSDDPFEDLNDDWDLISFDAQIIKLIDVSGGNGGTDYLNFGRNPYEDCNGGGNTTELTNILKDGQWFVQSYIDDGDDETNDYSGYILTFNTDGSVIAENSSNTITGTWSVVNSSNGLDVILDFGTAMPFDEFNDDWDVDTYTTTRVELFDISGGNGGTDYLTFEKL
ncbi:hypothetical protein [Aequorivita lipolytica]|uniref:Uncharacterized protein n=1 Tax=Aequorivita lipolytica TaxID=153267 RepID=A0A5C6YR50_9FLAO|nr:hypothetical protein [Aequorivita lipolytica]TXD69859.1 hypothetical protein ESV24_05320 [Aequorivita lipolytica]SRX50324.1 hypothetical protein AEQU2_00796 [Aequorivita lipolytica]